jgi:hypothetical protein
MERSNIRVEQEDYGDAAEMMKRVSRAFTGLRFHFGVTALAKDDKDRDGTRVVVPNLTGAVLKDFHAMTDLIMFLSTETYGDTPLRTGLTVPSGQYQAKDTFGVMPRRLADPTFPRVLEYVAEIITPKTDAVQRAAILLAKGISAPSPEPTPNGTTVVNATESEV